MSFVFIISSRFYQTLYNAVYVSYLKEKRFASAMTQSLQQSLSWEADDRSVSYVFLIIAHLQTLSWDRLFQPKP